MNYSIIASDKFRRELKKLGKKYSRSNRITKIFSNLWKNHPPKEPLWAEIATKFVWLLRRKEKASKVVDE